MNSTIWIINQFAGTPESGWGERHFYFAKYWVESGYDVKIISGSWNHMFKKNQEVNGLYKHEQYEGIDFYWVKTPQYNPRSVLRFWSMMVFAWRVLRLPVKTLGIPRAIVVSSMPIFPIYSGYRIARKYKAKLLFEIRDIWPLTLQLLGNKSKNHPAVQFIGWFEKFGYRKSDHVVSLLPNAREHIEEVAGKSVSFQYIPNGVDESQIGYDKYETKKLDAISNSKFVIGYAGTLGLANALEYFVEASKLLESDNRFHFVLVGDGYLRSELERSTASQENISFYDKIPKRQVQSLLERFDVCFVGRNDTPLFKHGVSANKYFDYMLASKPILDSNNKIKDPVELSGCGVIVQPDSAQAIVDGIYELHNLSEQERKEMGERGRTFVLEHHNIKNLATQYSNLF